MCTSQVVREHVAFVFPPSGFPLSKKALVSLSLSSPEEREAKRKMKMRSHRCWGRVRPLCRACQGRTRGEGNLQEDRSHGPGTPCRVGARRGAGLDPRQHIGTLWETRCEHISDEDVSWLAPLCFLVFWGHVSREWQRPWRVGRGRTAGEDARERV